MIDRVLYNGNIVTLGNPARVSALALINGRIVASGNDADMLALAGANTKRENLGGKTVIPGMIDAHIHWSWTSRALNQVQIFELPSKDLIAQRVAERVAQTPANNWVMGWGWSQDFWTNPAFPTAADLDAISPNNPVYLIAKSGHAAWVNSVALRLCNVTASTPNPEGGEIVRDEHGQPTGVLFENAMSLVRDAIPEPSPYEIATMMAGAQKLALASGMTGLHDFDGPDSFAALQILRERGDLGLRVVKNINKEWFQPALDLGLRWGFGNEWLRVGGLKIFMDGALGPRTAYMIEPYEGEPNNYGIVVTDKEEIMEWVSKGSAAGFPATVHAIGDRAIHDVLDVYEAIRGEEAQRGEKTASRRHRIEHVQLIHPGDIHRLAQLDVIASMQPIHATSDYQASDRSWGERSKWAYNIRLQLDQGAKIALGSDSPVEPFEPLKGIYAAVARRRPDGSPGVDGWYPELRLTVDEALRGFTQGAAYAAGLEKVQGTLAPGFLADLVVLDRDIYTVPAEEILETQVLGTMVNGAWSFGGID